MLVQFSSFIQFYGFYGLVYLCRLIQNHMHTNINILLNLLFVAFALESLQRLSAVALLGLTLLLKDFDSLIESLNGCALHLQLLWKRRKRQSVTVHLMLYCISFSLKQLNQHIMYFSCLQCNFSCARYKSANTQLNA